MSESHRDPMRRPKGTRRIGANRTARSRDTDRRDGGSHFIAGGGEMGTLIRERDWSATALGPVETWPQSLRSAVSILLPSRAQIVLFWGPELITIYNDAYAPVFAAKHPWALGRPARECWSEVWHVLGPLFEGVVRTGKAFWAKDHPFVLLRQGFLEETYFDVSYDPVRIEDGSVGGVFCIVSEQTGRVLGERRLRALRELGARTADARSAEEVCREAATALATDPADVPFSLLYLIDAPGFRAELVRASGVEIDDIASGRDVVIADVDALASVRTGRAVETETRAFVTRAPATAADRVLVLPISVGTQTVGALVAGVSRFLRLAGDYRDFFDLAAARISAALANVQAFEEERRRAEALAELDRAKTAFFSNVSHEFRTPLTLMLGPVGEILAKPGDQVLPDTRALLTVAQRNGLRLQKLVNTLLDFSRIEAGRVQAVYEPTDLAEVTAELASNFRSACERAGLALVVDCPPLPEAVYVDREMWEKIVLNLLSNAFKFTFEGEIAVTLRAAGGVVELAVRDTGIGIPPVEIPRVFDRFHRVEDARGRTQEGTGIGLALVQELAKLHGGSVRVESTLGRGSTFTVSVPTGEAHLPADRIGRTRALASTASGADPYVEEALRWLPDAPSLPLADPLSHGTGPAAPRAQPSLSAAFTRARILWADDNADMRDYVRRLLGAHYEVETVADGHAALAALRTRRPDLVLADVMMPKLDGFGLLRELRADPETRTLPVILLSARAGEEARVEGLEAGADAYLVKPFNARELLAHVAARLEIAHVRGEALRRERALRDDNARLYAAEQRARTHAENANQAKDEFLATLSHELRTPLNAMLGWVRLLRSGRLDEATARRGLEVIDRNVDHQAKLITDLLDISRIISGKLTLEMAVVDLTDIVASVVEAMRPVAEAKSVTVLSTPLTPGAIPVHGDGERLRQVVANLLSNAVKFTPTGGRVTVRLERVGDLARLCVSDTGQGIRGEFLPHIFERFRQADGSSTRAEAGLGLGLAIVRHIVELHNGSVRAESPGEGKGATFTVDLPIATPREDRGVDARDTSEIAGPATSRLDGVRVLVVDDDNDSRDLFTAILTQRGAGVTAVRSVREALAAARHAPPDVVVCDIAMPGDDGFALIREVRSWPIDQGGRVPALALTAYARLEDRAQALAAGFHVHLAKPVEPRDLVEAVTRLALEARGRGRRRMTTRGRARADVNTARNLTEEGGPAEHRQDP